MQIKEGIGQQKVMAFEIEGYCIFRYQGRLCVPNVDVAETIDVVELHCLGIEYLASSIHY